MGGDHRPWGLEQRGEEVVEVETALPCGADDAGEDLLGLRATLRAIAATDLAIDHGGPDGVLGSPVGRVDGDGPEEGEHGREFAVEMGGEAEFAHRCQKQFIEANSDCFEPLGHAGEGKSSGAMFRYIKPVDLHQQLEVARSVEHVASV